MSVIYVRRTADGALNVTFDRGYGAGVPVFSLDTDLWTTRRCAANPPVDEVQLASTLAVGLSGLAQRVVEHDRLDEPVATVARRLADAALSQARDVAVPHDHLTRLGSVARLSEALERGTIGFVCESMWALDRAQPARFELLLRLDTGTDLVRPGRMIADAEWAGFRSVDGAAFRQAGWLLNQLADLGSPAPIIHVNVSVADPVATLRNLEAIIASEGFDPGGLCLELTETSRIDFAAAKELVHGTHELGCTVFADDFGDGAGSPPIDKLSELGLDGIKLSGLFEQAKFSPAMRRVASALVGLARDMGISSVAERVSDHASQQLARDIGFNYAQGWLFGQGVPVTQVVEAAAAEAAT